MSYAGKTKSEKNTEYVHKKQNNNINEKNNIKNAKENVETDAATVSNEELMKQLAVLNLTIDTLQIILLAIFLNINFVKGEKAKLLDQINNTNFSKSLPDLTDTPRITNLMFIYAGGVFLEINYNSYKEAVAAKGKNRNIKTIRMAWKRVLSSILGFIAAIIGRDNIEE